MFKKILKGESPSTEEKVDCENVEALRSFITFKRIELLKIINKQKPNSIYELASLVHRDLKSVMTDLTILASLGLVELKKENKSREKIHPVVNYDRIQIEIVI